MENCKSHFSRAICLFLATMVSISLYGQQKLVSTTYYPGTKTKKVEYEYLSGKVGNVSDIKIKDKATGLTKERDFNTYGVNSMTPHGYWREYYENGSLQVEYNYINGSREGVAKSFFDNGKPSVVYSYKNNVIDGDFAEYYDNGILQAKCIYVNGKRTGNSTVYDESGVPIIYLTYQEPTETGNYVAPGEKEVVVQVSSLTKHKNGKVSEEGHLLSKYSQDRYASTYYYDSFLRQGNFISYDENGVKIEQKNYNNGMLDGLSTTFYPNGNKKEETTYKPFKTTDKLLTIVEGPYREYYENGQLSQSGIKKSIVAKASDGEYEAEQFSFGDWRKYNENGKLIQFISYGENESVHCEMDEKLIEEQSQISDQLGTNLYKLRTLDKFSIYLRFHYGSIMTEFKEKLNEAESYRFANEIENRASEVFIGYRNQLDGCTDSNCIKQYADKLDNLVQKTYHIQSVNQVADKLLEPGQKIQTVLKI